MTRSTKHRKLKIEQHETHLIQGVNSGASERQPVPAPLVVPWLCSIFLFYRVEIVQMKSCLDPSVSA